MVLQASLLALFSFLQPISFQDVPKYKPVLLSELTQLALPTATPAPAAIPEQKILDNGYHITQSFNNCGPASLSVVLSYFGIEKSQEELGNELRPYQNPVGDNDDKSVTLEELGAKAEEMQLNAYHRPNGNIAILREFIANDIPVMTRTWMKADEDIGHYRVITGYNQKTKTLVFFDTFEGQTITYTYDEFNEVWSKFNYEYLVIVPKEKKKLTEQILGENIQESFAWEQARDMSLRELETDPENPYSRFNLAVAYYHLGDYKKTVTEYEKAASQLPFRTLWYQIEPIDAYFKIGDYDKVFAITDDTLNNQNRAYSELYILRGKIYEKQGDTDAARNEYENAVYYNTSLKSAQGALANL